MSKRILSQIGKPAKPVRTVMRGLVMAETRWLTLEEFAW